MRPTAPTGHKPGRTRRSTDSGAWRRFLLALLLCLALPPSAGSQERPRLLVYLHTNIRARALQTALESKLPGMDVVVCGRYHDFVRELARSTDAALALQPVLTALGMSYELKGVRGGEETERYVLLSVGRSIRESEFPRLTIGAVDLLGRENTAKFVARLLGLPRPPDIQYVVKLEDLLALLRFQRADAVLLPELEAKQFQNISKLDFRVLEIPERVGLPALAFRTQIGRTLVKSGIENLDLETKRKLGVDGWR